MMGLFKWLAWTFRYPWPRSAIEGRIRPLRISLCTEEHFEKCVALFVENESHGVPSEHRASYASKLADGNIRTLLVEDGDKPVGTFGVQYGSMPNTYWLCYMLVCPECHRKGVGTTMFLAALALLPEDHSGPTLWISALPAAVSFYSRLGFQFVGEHQYPDGGVYQLARMNISPEMSRSCRRWLAAAGVLLPTPPYDIPTAEMNDSTVSFRSEAWPGGDGAHPAS
jgi:GNAT superfamily N-acetyltransferase